MSIFDIIGPVMIGPSSSHTAGAVRLGRMARYLLDDEPALVRFALAGSFAATGVGHGTHEALLGGVLGLDPDNPQIIDAMALAEGFGLVSDFTEVDVRTDHPNTVWITLEGKGGASVKMVGSSIGGGRIKLLEVDGLQIDQEVQLTTLLTTYQDRPGVVAAVTRILAGYHMNIAGMKVYRSARGKTALMLLETDDSIPKPALEAVRRLPSVIWVRYVPLLR